MSYDDAFYSANAQIALHDASIILPPILKATHAKVVIDVGCATGAWAKVAADHGCAIHAVDGYVDTANLLIDPNDFEQRDLSGGYPCEGYDLAICLEFAEHLPATSTGALIAGLCEARYVLFSGAHPGQRGEGHINEQWQTWWAEWFLDHGYVGAVDIRKQHWDDDSLQWYYKENVVLYGQEDDLLAIGYKDFHIADVVHPGRNA